LQVLSKQLAMLVNFIFLLLSKDSHLLSNMFGILYKYIKGKKHCMSLLVSCRQISIILVFI